MEVHRQQKVHMQGRACRTAITTAVTFQVFTRAHSQENHTPDRAPGYAFLSSVKLVCSM